MGSSQSQLAAQAGTPHVPSSKSAPIVIIGGSGTIGSSTALHLARRGYTNIRILDVYSGPSADSAGNDINKISGSDGGPGVWGEYRIKAWEMWKTDPVFKPYHHPVGKLDMTSGDTASAAGLRREYDYMIESGRKDVEWLQTPEDIYRRAPHLTGRDVNDWRGIYCSEGGYVSARSALASVAAELQKLGVKSAFGTAGSFKTLLLSADGKTCRGVEAVDGTEWEAETVILAAGAWSPALIDLEGQCESKCWIYGHIQLTEEERKAFEGIPTVYHNQLGFFMEPSPTGLLKLCNEFPGFTNMTSAQPFPLNAPITLSVPRSHASHPTDTIPSESIADLERLIDVLLPQFKGRELVNQAMCWCTDTPDANWLIAHDPRWKGLVLATGDSGHSFNMLPVVGGVVADLLEGKLPEEARETFKWRPGYGDPKGTGRGGPRPKDLADLDGWRHD